jgi:hypothetical protein
MQSSLIDHFNDDVTIWAGVRVRASPKFGIKKD